MSTVNKRLLVIVFSLLTLAPRFSHAEETIEQQPRATKEKSAWAFSMDNDLFVPGRKSDMDFTGGFALTYSGNAGLKYWKSVDRVLSQIDSALLGNINQSSRPKMTPSVEFGAYGFTPNNIEAESVSAEDRPYASIVYLSVRRAYQEDANGDSWSSTLSLGLLGLSVFGDLQNGVHDLLGSKTAAGWDNQIANGGEPTLRYQLAYNNHWNINLKSGSAHYKTTYFGSVGYLTEAGVALSTRNGLIASPDSRFNPELVNYGERLNDTALTSGRGEESYFWGGAAIKLRLYNAFLQGQFRESKHAIGSQDLSVVLVEAWAGYTFSIGQSIQVSYSLRAQTSEIRQGKGDRAMVWGGIVVSQKL